MKKLVAILWAFLLLNCIKGEEIMDFSKIDQFAGKFTNESPTDDDWIRWEKTLGISFPVEYKAFCNRYPNAFINYNFKFEHPSPTKLPYNDAAILFFNPLKEWGPLKTTFKKWPKNGGFFKILNPIRENYTVAFKVVDGKIEKDRVYVVALEFDDVIVFEGGFLSFMEAMLNQKFERSSTIGYLSFLMTHDPLEDGAKPLQELKWGTEDQGTQYYNSFTEEEKDILRKHDHRPK